MKNQYDLIIVGAGALGTWHAYWALKKGLKVLVIERDMKPNDATVRNFGQVVPSGMSKKWFEYGRVTTATYKEIQEKFDISIRNNGSLYIASSKEELTLLEELQEIMKEREYDSILFTKEETLLKYANIKNDYCYGSLFFAQEVSAEPDKLIHQVLSYLQTQEKFTYINNTTAVVCDEFNGKNFLEDAAGNEYYADRILICSGRDFRTLFPNVFYESELQICKLNMLSTFPQKQTQLLGNILTGLTIRRYSSFKETKSYSSLPIQHEKKELNDWGIHILFKQAIDGSVIIGDSHEYADAKEAEILYFGIETHINDLIINEAKQIVDLDNWNVQRTWAGFYAQHKRDEIFHYAVKPNIEIITGIGGKGMTTACGWVKKNVLGW